MKYILVPLALLLTGCVSVPVKHSFPKPPELIVEKCVNLNVLKEDEERLSELLKVVTVNYNLYYECATRQELLVKWLREQSAIHDALFNKGK
jgi:starvation-inducible outer membrane lipoprotein